MTALGTTTAGFVIVTVLMMGFAAWMTGRAIAATWRPAWQVPVYSLLLGVADRFFVYVLAEGELFSLAGYVVDTLILCAIAALAYRLTQVRKMVTQYPWLYEMTGPLSWKTRTNEP
jgi:hypothetical protein